MLSMHSQFSFPFLPSLFFPRLKFILLKGKKAKKKKLDLSANLHYWMAVKPLQKPLDELELERARARAQRPGTKSLRLGSPSGNF